jgi:hypothetical protein
MTNKSTSSAKSEFGMTQPQRLSAIRDFRERWKSGSTTAVKPMGEHLDYLLHLIEQKDALLKAAGYTPVDCCASIKQIPRSSRE